MRPSSVPNVCLCALPPPPRSEEHFPDQRHEVRRSEDGNGTQPRGHGPRAGGESAPYGTGPSSPSFSFTPRFDEKVQYHLSHKTIVESSSL